MQLSVTVNLDYVFSSFPTGPPVRDEAFHNRWWSSLHSNGKLRQSSFCMFPLSTWALGVCVAPEFLWWNRDPQGKALWIWACGESWGQRAELSWILCYLKWEKLLFSCPLRREANVVGFLVVVLFLETDLIQLRLVSSLLWSWQWLWI